MGSLLNVPVESLLNVPFLTFAAVLLVATLASMAVRRALLPAMNQACTTKARATVNVTIVNGFLLFLIIALMVVNAASVLARGV